MNELRNKCQAASICYDIAYEVVESGISAAVSAWMSSRSELRENVDGKQDSTAESIDLGL